MKWVNHNHLYYFWRVAREGSVVKAAEAMLVSQPTVSIQVKALEASLGHVLFERSGRGLRLTDAGQTAFRYAEEMFSLSREMVRALEERQERRGGKLAVGIVDVIPKRVVRRLLQPALALEPRLRLICREDTGSRLLAELEEGRVDVVLSDAPIGTGVHVKGFNHLLIECGIAFLAKRELAKKHRLGFPRSLSGAPLLLPSEHTTVRQALNGWFDGLRIHPEVVGEFDDTALMVSMAQDGRGIFPIPRVVSEGAEEELGMEVVGKTEEARQRFYAISREEEPGHPAVAAICGRAGAGRRKGEGRAAEAGRVRERGV
jgi:LysR family transcriptional activator of nhaA